MDNGDYDLDKMFEYLAGLDSVKRYMAYQREQQQKKDEIKKMIAKGKVPTFGPENNDVPNGIHDLAQYAWNTELLNGIDTDKRTSHIADAMDIDMSDDVQDRTKSKDHKVVQSD